MPKKTGVLTTLDTEGNLLEMYPDVEVDATLTQLGKPADAAAVGAAISNIQPGDNSVTLTQAEYDALSDEEKASDTTYYISDGDAQPNAFSVPFTSDKYAATTAGDALEEVKNGLEETNSALEGVKADLAVTNSNLIKAFPITKTVTVQQDSYAMGGYKAVVNISDFDDYDAELKSRAVAIIPTCCYYSTNASVVGAVSLLADGNRITINASNEGNYLVGLVILYK